MVEDIAVRFPATRRAMAKQQTRRRLIAAARALVAERGYEAATLREMAARADVSTGAVFANFADKADLFNAVIIDDHADLLVQMKRAAAEATSTHQALRAVFAAGYALHAGQLSLVQAQLGFSWVNDRAVEQRSRAGVRQIQALLVEILGAGVDSGDLAPSIDVGLIAEMVWDSYVANYRRAIFDGWSLETLQSRIGRQIDILLDGYRTDAATNAQPSWPTPAPRLAASRPTALRG